VCVCTLCTLVHHIFISVGNKIVEWFSKYWIIGFYILLLLMAIQEPYIYRLIYMIFFLFSAITFQVSYSFCVSKLLALAQTSFCVRFPVLF